MCPQCADEGSCTYLCLVQHGLLAGSSLLSRRRGCRPVRLLRCVVLLPRLPLLLLVLTGVLLLLPVLVVLRLSRCPCRRIFRVYRHRLRSPLAHSPVAHRPPAFLPLVRVVVVVVRRVRRPSRCRVVARLLGRCRALPRPRGKDGCATDGAVLLALQPRPAPRPMPKSFGRMETRSVSVLPESASSETNNADQSQQGLSQ